MRMVVHALKGHFILLEKRYFTDDHLVAVHTVCWSSNLCARRGSYYNAIRLLNAHLIFLVMTIWSNNQIARPEQKIV